MTEDTLAALVDKQATMIKQMRVAFRDLRTRVEALEAALDVEVTRKVQTIDGSVAEASKGVFVPRRVCASCGKPKPASRKDLTCKECGQKRAMIVSQKWDRTPLLRDRCFNCGESFARSMRILCPPCSESFKEWKANK